jgi:hypothetical protein
MTGLTAFWTDADEAELDVLVHTLVVDFFEHRERCSACRPNRSEASLPCPHLQKAIREVFEWRESRLLLSRAQALRSARNKAPA